MNRLNALLFSAGSLAFAAAVQAAPFAMITDVKGDAWVMEGGKPRKLALLSYIESPSEVKVDPSTKLGVTYFANGMQYSFAGPARVSVTYAGLDPSETTVNVVAGQTVTLDVAMRAAADSGV